MQWCIPIGKGLSHKVKQLLRKGKQLECRCHNDATILRRSCGSIMALLCWPIEVVYTLNGLIQPSEIAVVLKIFNQRQATTLFKETISNYLPPDSTFFGVLKYSTYITRLEKITKQHKTHLYVTHDKTKIFIMINMWTNFIVIFEQRHQSSYEGAILAYSWVVILCQGSNGDIFI